MADFYTTRELADFLGTETWRVQRLFESGAIDEPPRFAGKRAIPRFLIGPIVAELQRRGWLPESDGAVEAETESEAKA